MEYKKYQKNLQGLESTLTFLREHTLQNRQPLSPRENGEAVIDSDRYLSSHDIELRLCELRDPEKFPLKSFGNPLIHFYRNVREYRSKSAACTPFKSFLGRWESRLEHVRRGLSEWREKVKIQISLTNYTFQMDFEEPNPHKNQHDMLSGPEDSFRYEARQGSINSNLKIKVTPNYFTHVLPLFGIKVLDWKDGSAQGGDLAHKHQGSRESRRLSVVEKVATRSDGTSTFQYMVLAAENVETDINGVPNDHGIKVVKFHALETFGRNEDRKF